MNNRHVNYMIRRETHSPRAVLTGVVALIVGVLATWLAVETILYMANTKPLLASPPQMAQAIKNPGSYGAPAAIITVAVIAALIGLFLIIVALKPGRLDWHGLNDQRTAFVVDDRVIASALSKTAREVAGLPAGQVTTRLSARTAEVTVTPTSGQAVDKQAIQSAVQKQIESLGFAEQVNATVRINERGRVPN